MFMTWLACSTPEPDPLPVVEEPLREVAHTWTDNALTIEGFPDARLEVKCCAAGQASLTSERWPRGAVLTVGDTTLDAETKHATASLVSSVGDLDLSALKLSSFQRSKQGVKHPKLAFTLPVTVQLQGPWALIETVTPPLETDANYAGLLLSDVAEGVHFSTDPDKPVDTALVRWRSYGLRVVGAGTLLRDVDIVVTESWSETSKTRRCGGYSNVPNHPGDISIEVSLHDSVLTFTDRRTGEEVASQVFHVEDGCPSWAPLDGAARGAAQEPMLAAVEGFLDRG